MLIKQENMMGSPDGYSGNMGVCLATDSGCSSHRSHDRSVQHLCCICYQAR